MLNERSANAVDVLPVKAMLADADWGQKAKRAIAGNKQRWSFGRLPFVALRSDRFCFCAKLFSRTNRNIMLPLRQISSFRNQAEIIKQVNLGVNKTTPNAVSTTNTKLGCDAPPFRVSISNLANRPPRGQLQKSSHIRRADDSFYVKAYNAYGSDGTWIYRERM